MKIALLNGSPKVNQSASGSLLEDLKRQILKRHSEKIEFVEIALHHSVVSQEAIEKLKNIEVWVFAYPLYVDAVPAHLLSCLVQLEKINWNCKIHIYGIVNCGFYEGIQATFALQVLQNWCIKSRCIWGGGIGVGGGGCLVTIPTLENGHGPKEPINKALGTMADKMLQKEVLENQYVSIAFPRFLYKMAAQMGWRQMIRANGGKKKDLGKQL